MTDRGTPLLAALARWRASPRRRLTVGAIMLILGVTVLVVGGAYAATARPVNPVEVDGHISAYAEITVNGAYARNELRLAGDPHTYLIDGGQFHPALPPRFLKDGRVVIWVDRGTPDVLAITLYDELGLNPETYTTTAYDHPTLAGRGRQIGGSIAALIGLIVLLIGLVWALKIPAASGPAAQRPPSVPAGPPPSRSGEPQLAAGKMPAIRVGGEPASPTAAGRPPGVAEVPAANALMPPAAASPASAPAGGPPGLPRSAPVASGPGGGPPFPSGPIPPGTSPPPHPHVPNQGFPPGPPNQGGPQGQATPPPGAWSPQSWAAAFGAPAGPSGPRAPGAPDQPQPGGWPPQSAPGQPASHPIPPVGPVSGPGPNPGPNSRPNAGPNQWPPNNPPAGPQSRPQPNSAPTPQAGPSGPRPPEPPRR